MFASANAIAADAGVDDDAGALLKQLEQEWSALSTQDCVTACKAYASIRRAADRICGLEPGPRCVDARAKADDAQRRVQAACPDCRIASVPPREDERRAAEPAPPTVVDAKGGAAGDAESAPRKGGCASCSTPGGSATGDLGGCVLGALALAHALRRRRASRS